MFRAFACDTAARQGENYAILCKRKESTGKTVITNLHVFEPILFITFWPDQYPYFVKLVSGPGFDQTVGSGHVDGQIRIQIFLEG